MAWWDARRSRASTSSPTPPKSSRMDRLKREEQLPQDIASLALPAASDLLSPISEEQKAPAANPPPLLVRVAVQFTDPIIRSQYSRSYASSQNFIPSDRICTGLLRRLDHCCEELMTRKDSTALDSWQEETGAPKRQRYEITFRISRRGSGQCVERTFRSYQKQPLTVSYTKQVILATHRMVGLFLKCHDKDFRWLHEPVQEDCQGPDMVQPSPHGPLSPCCIPRARFVEALQSFEFVPGYAIVVSFRSRTPQPARTQFGKVLRINSRQNAPLNLFLAEELLWEITGCVQASLGAKKRQFDADHHHCEGFEGLTACSHLDDEAFHIDLRIANNLGPSYDHLHRGFQSKLKLFHDSDHGDSLDFLQDLEAQLGRARDAIDDKISLLNDFELRVLELRSPTWSLRSPLKICLDPAASYSRRTIEAVLERVQTGIGDVLRGHNLAVHLAAYKRGHLVLDKALVARQAPNGSRLRAASSEAHKQDLVARLESRIRQDIDMVCRDTCSLEGIPMDEAPWESMAAESSAAAMLTKSGQTAEARAGEPAGEVPVQRRFSLLGGSISRPHSSEDHADDTKSAGSQAGHSGDHAARRSTPIRTASTRNSVNLEREATPSPRVFPLVPSRYSMASRSSSGSTLASEHADALPPAVPTDVPSEEMKTPDTPVLDASGDMPKSAPREEPPTEESVVGLEEKKQAAATPETEGAPALANTQPLEATQQLDTAAEEEPSRAKTLKFSLGPPIDLVRGSAPRSLTAQDWDSASSDTADDDDDDDGSGALIYEQPRGEDAATAAAAAAADDFARTRIDVMETSQYLPLESTHDDDDGAPQQQHPEDGHDEDDDLPRAAAAALAGGVDDGDVELENVTAPSTPGLSSGCDSSPRNSILVTPTVQRTHALAAMAGGILAVSALDFAKGGGGDDGGPPVVREEEAEDEEGAEPSGVVRVVAGEGGAEEESAAVVEELGGREEKEEEHDGCAAERGETLREDGHELGLAVADAEEKQRQGAAEAVSQDASPAAAADDGGAEDSPDWPEAEFEDACTVELPLGPSEEGSFVDSDADDAEIEDSEARFDITTGVDQDRRPFENEDVAATNEPEPPANVSVISEADIPDPAAVELPPSPEIQPSESGDEIATNEHLEASEVLMEPNAWASQAATSDVLGRSEEAALLLPELAGPEAAVPFIDLDPPTSVPETKDIPTTFELDGQELQELDSDAVEADVVSYSRSDALQPAVLAAPGVSEWLNLSELLSSQPPELGGDDLSGPSSSKDAPPPAEPSPSAAQAAAAAAAYPQTATSTSSYLTARELPNPFDQLLASELDSVPVTAATHRRLHNNNSPDLPPSPTASHYTFVSTASSRRRSASRSPSPHRDSVDTIAPPPTTASDPPPPERSYRPSTAGWLGFREADLTRRFSMPLQYIWDRGGGGGSGSESGTPRPGTPLSASTAAVRERRTRPAVLAERPRPASEATVLGPSAGRDGGETGREAKGVLPKVVMLFAGMAFASKVLDGDK